MTDLIDWPVASTVAYLKPWANRRVVIETCLSTLVAKGMLSVEQSGSARRALLVIASAQAGGTIKAFRRNPA